MASPAPSAAALAEGQRHATNLSWLILLRWGALLGEGAMIVGVDRWSQIQLPVAPLLAILAFGLLTNAGLALWVRRRRAVAESLVAATLALDLALLTALLALTGGPHNPFTALYLVHIALAPVVLGARWTWLLVALAVGGYALLFARSLSLDLRGGDHATHMRIHLQGMWLAFTIAAAFIGYFVHKVQRARARLEAQLAEARARQARSEKLSALATLAAGAAHELSTPLSTIAIAIKEMQRRLEAEEAAAPLLDDARLIREQVDRCRVVLEQMAVDAGAGTGEAPTTIAVGTLLEACAEGLDGVPPVARHVAPSLRGTTVHLPVRSLAMAIRGLAKNAQQASAAGGQVELEAATRDGALVITVRDHGAGMPPEILARAGEPFFTTKPAGQGMGLGLFLAGAVAEHLSGELRVESRPNEGTTVHLALPISAQGPAPRPAA